MGIGILSSSLITFCDIRAIFRHVDPSKIIIIPTSQKSQYDLTNWGGDVELEKNRLLERFTSWAKHLCQRIIARGYWADYIDPCSGLPMIHKKGTTPYGEVEGFSVLLGYHVTNAGCCKILVHPEWGTYFYPATLFTNASGEIISEIIQDLENDNELFSQITSLAKMA